MRSKVLGSCQERLWHSYGYRRLGELAEQQDSMRKRIEYSYDPAGRLLRKLYLIKQRCVI